VTIFPKLEFLSRKPGIRQNRLNFKIPGQARIPGDLPLRKRVGATLCEAVSKLTGELMAEFLEEKKYCGIFGRTQGLSPGFNTGSRVIIEKKFFIADPGNLINTRFSTNKDLRPIKKNFIFQILLDKFIYSNYNHRMIKKLKIEMNVSLLLKPLYKANHGILLNSCKINMFQIPELLKGFKSSALDFGQCVNVNSSEPAAVFDYLPVIKVVDLLPPGYAAVGLPGGLGCAVGWNDVAKLHECLGAWGNGEMGEWMNKCMVTWLFGSYLIVNCQSLIVNF